MVEYGSGSSNGNGDFFSRVSKAVGRLQSAVGLQAFCDALTQQVRTMTGLDRVMVYKFHADLHGEVIAEHVVGAQRDGRRAEAQPDQVDQEQVHGRRLAAQRPCREKPCPDQCRQGDQDQRQVAPALAAGPSLPT